MSQQPGDVPDVNRKSPISIRQSTFVSRGGEKLQAALDGFQLNVSGLTCADFGAHTGGFTDCLLQRGAAHVFSVDTCYGTLAWKLRRDPRVTVYERTNAIHISLPRPVDLVVIDAGWTPQRLILPAARRNLAPGGHVVTLIKPHYEADSGLLRDGVVPDELFGGVVLSVLESIRQQGWTIKHTVESPLRGHGGNKELLAWLCRAGEAELREQASSGPSLFKK